MTTDFQSQILYGKEAEMVFQEIFRYNGYSIMPVYEKVLQDYKGPRVSLAFRDVIAPDLFVFGNGQEPHWVEVKRKESATWYYKGGYWCVGIDKRLWNDYVVVDCESPFRVWLMFMLEGGISKDAPPNMSSPEGFFGAPLEHLLKRLSHDPHEISYFPVMELERYASMLDVSRGNVRFRFDFQEPTRTNYLADVRRAWGYHSMISASV